MFQTLYHCDKLWNEKLNLQCFFTNSTITTTGTINYQEKPYTWELEQAWEGEQQSPMMNLLLCVSNKDQTSWTSCQWIARRWFLKSQEQATTAAKRLSFGFRLHLLASVFFYRYWMTALSEQEERKQWLQVSSQKMTCSPWNSNQTTCSLIFNPYISFHLQALERCVIPKMSSKTSTKDLAMNVLRCNFTRLCMFRLQTEEICGKRILCWVAKRFFLMIRADVSDWWNLMPISGEVTSLA